MTTQGKVIDFVAYKEVRDEKERGWLEALLEEIVEKQQMVGDYVYGSD
jgi:hypothetical protein